VKPAELKPLIGRNVGLYWNGYRTGKVVGAPKADTLRIQLLPPYGRRTVALDQVCQVFWYGKVRTVAEYLALRK
jgi:hypothetical protein